MYRCPSMPLYHCTTPLPLFLPPPPLHLAMNMSKRVWSGRTYEYVPHSLELIRKCFLSNFHETHHLLFTKTWRKYEIFSIAKIEYSIYTNNFEYPFSFYDVSLPKIEIIIFLWKYFCSNSNMHTFRSWRGPIFQLNYSPAIRNASCWPISYGYPVGLVRITGGWELHPPEAPPLFMSLV